MRVIVTVILGTLLLATQALGQYDPKALEILEGMSAKYKSIPAFTAKFNYSLENKMEKVNEEFTGEISVKGDKYKIKMSGQEIMNDGKTVWTYLSDANEVNIDNYDPNSEEVTPTKIFTAYRKGYKYIFLNEKTESGVVYEMIDLVPEDKDLQFFRIRLQINKKDKTLKNWEIYDKAGNIYRYTISNFNSSVTLTDANFRFDASKYPGVEIIDLR